MTSERHAVAQPRVTLSARDINAAIYRMQRVLESGALSKGPENDELVGRLSPSQDHRALTVASGGLALEVALTAMRPEAGRAALVPQVAHWSDYAAAIRSRYEVTLAPVEAGTGHLDIPRLMEDRPTVGVVVYVAMGGWIHPLLPSLEGWCKARGILLLCDMSHAVGATLRGRPALSFGDVAVASMFATKVVTGAEGGAIVTARDDLYEDMDKIRDGGRGGPGWRDAYFGVGVNARMSELHAALANVHMGSLGERLAKRRELAEEYEAGLWGHVPVVPWREGSLYKFTILAPDALFLSRLVGVRPSATVYETPIYEHPGFLDDMPASTEGAEAWSHGHVCLPMHETLSVDDARVVIERVKEAL